MAVTREQVLALLYPVEPRYEQAAHQLGPEALPHLRQIVEEGDPELASKAAFLAGVVNAAGSAEVLAAAAGSSDPVIRVVAAGALGHLDEVPSSLAHSMLDDEDVGVRIWALRSLESQQPAGFKQKVQQMAADDPSVALQEIASRVVDELP
jgi:hypothetical protein